MQRVVSPQRISAITAEARRRGHTIGFVPTMGFLHEGHISLMRIARDLCDELVVSIYVNPKQFGPGEDLDRYPRDLEGDADKCEGTGVDWLFVPDDLYGDCHCTTVSVSGLSQGLCGAARPGHFDGVTTVVARLFGLTHPHVAVFGEKDYQQLAIIRRMTLDLALDVEIVGGPLVRDVDGLALSSRNKYLDPEQRKRALTLHRALFAMRDSGERNAASLVSLGRRHLDVDKLDYLEVVDAHTLQPVAPQTREARALVAAHLGGTRLIDNVGIPWT